MNGKYQNIIDQNIIIIYDEIEISIDKTNKKTKQNVKFAKYLESKTKLNLDPFKINENFNKFNTWVKIL